MLCPKYPSVGKEAYGLSVGAKSHPLLLYGSPETGTRTYFLNTYVVKEAGRRFQRKERSSYLDHPIRVMTMHLVKQKHTLIPCWMNAS